jgi:pyruvate-ferredoxin/flavodoxin oxidoreductase
VGINDDVTHLSLPFDPAFRTDAVREPFAAVFYGLGSDGTVSANKNSIKIIGDETELYAQGYFVYDSKKSGAMTVSHLRFGPQPIRSTYLTGEGDAGFIACHQPLFLETHDLLAHAAPARSSCSTPVPAEQGLASPAGPGSSRWSPSASISTSSTPTRWRRRPTWGAASIP